ncbi:MAG: hypothetical protein QOI08_109 [Actinomycetota bacterium]|jgi:hypothetical protein|nr:hypothetical protein [Actinomycetota bacterium]
MATSTNPHLIQSPFGFDSTTAEVIDGIDLFAIVGRYFEDCNQGRVLDPDVPNTTISGVAVYALDPANANRLSEISLALLGLEQ